MEINTNTPAHTFATAITSLIALAVHLGGRTHATRGGLHSIHVGDVSFGFVPGVDSCDVHTVREGRYGRLITTFDDAGVMAHKITVQLVNAAQ